MSMARTYYEINDRNNKILIESFKSQDNEKLQANGHDFLVDLDNWIKVLSNRPEQNLYEVAFKEYQYALIFVSQGFYRQAYSSLRFFVEHTHAALFFSSREMELRLWKLGQQDILWSTIVDEEQGFFSKKFFRAFSPFLLDEMPYFRDVAKKLYRECSEFIHGNFSTYNVLPENLEYNEAVFKEWHTKAETSRLLIVFSLCARYLGDISYDDKSSLEICIMDYIGYVKSIEEMFQMKEGVVSNA